MRGSGSTRKCHQCGKPIRAGRRFCGRACYGLANSGTLEARFWAGIDKAETGCWNWTGCVGTPGYGEFRFKNRLHRVHRVSWEIHNGSIPGGLFVLHRCDNRICANPAHLFLGTGGDNTEDMIAKGRNCRGVASHFAKLTETAVIGIRERHAKGGVTLRQLAGENGITPKMVRNIINRRNWKHL